MTNSFFTSYDETVVKSLSIINKEEKEMKKEQLENENVLNENEGEQDDFFDEEDQNYRRHRRHRRKPFKGIKRKIKKGGRIVARGFMIVGGITVLGLIGTAVATCGKKKSAGAIGCIDDWPSLPGDVEKEEKDEDDPFKALQEQINKEKAEEKTSN